MLQKGKLQKKIAAAVLVFSALASALSGCGNHSADNNEGTVSQASRNESGVDGAQSPGSTAMGRYVEEIIDLSDRINYGGSIFMLENGSLLISDMDNANDCQISVDNGVTWEADENAGSWKRALTERESIDSLAVRADNTTAVIYETRQDDSSEDENPFDVNYEVMLVRPDGERVPVEISVTEEDEHPYRVWISDKGRMFVSTYGPNLYEIKEDGSSELFLTLESAPILIQFQNNLMILDGWDYGELLIYDMEKREYIEDEVLRSFVRENYQDRSNNGGSFYDLYFFMGEENVLYLAGKKGLHRHVIGGNAIEQVIDGNLSVFNNPSFTLRGMLALDNSRFIALFSGGTVVRFTYNPDIPTVPSEKLKVYSLKESNTVRQAVTLYQMAYPEVYIEYEIGMEEGSSVTKEDALKSLNTKMMAEDGPDVLILDNMPADSYIEKGLLCDLSPLLDSLDGEEALFENLVDAFRTDGNIYMMPCEIELPVVYGPQSYSSKGADLSGLADAMEELREEEPGRNLFGICSAPGAMRLFSMISVPFWKTEAGEIDREALEDYLVSVKRIYDAQMEGLSEEAIAEYRDLQMTMLEYGYDMENDSEIVRENMDYMAYLMGERQILCSLMSGEYEYAALCSIPRMAEYEDDVIARMGSHVFYPRTLMGISSVSGNTEKAEAFVRLMLGKENQKSLFNGFAVNREAFQNLWKEEAGEDEEYSSIAMMDEDGQVFQLTVYWPGEKQAAKLQSFMETAKVPYIEDTVLEEAVYEAGAAYLQGEKSLEETLDAIEKKASIYMAE